MALAINSQEASGTAHRALASSLTWTFTNTAGTLLVVGAVVTAAATAESFGTVTYNDVTMNAGPSITWDAGNSIVGLFSLLSPATGPQSVVVNAGVGTPAILAGAISFTGNDATTPIAATTASATGSGTHATAGNITAASGNYVLGVGGWGSGVATTSVDHASTFALAGTGNTGGDDIATDIALSSGAAINAGFSWLTSDVWGIVAAEIKSAAAGDLSVNLTGDKSATAESAPHPDAPNLVGVIN